MNLNFYGGVDEIGGNKILIDNSSKNSKNNVTNLFLDFGMSFNQANSYFSEFLQARKYNGVGDFLELGLLPKIKGIYREDYLKHCGINSYSHASVDGVLLSHAHIDHSAYIHHLREDIPIYMTRESQIILDVIEKTGKASFSEFTKLKKTFHFVHTKKEDGFTALKGKDSEVFREIIIFKPYKPIEINEFKVISAPVDHSLPGSTAYFLENADDAIVYTGDLRFHGRNRDFTNKFTKKSYKFNPTIMICEGTRINAKPDGTEEDIEIKATDLINNHDGLVIVNYPFRDLDRLITFYNIAKNTGRILAINLKQAYMLKLLEDENNDKYPKLTDSSINIYVPRKRLGLLGSKHYLCYDGEWKIPKQDSDEVKRDYDKWEREFLEEDNIITYQDLKNQESAYIFRCDFFELKELIDIKPENGIYIHSLTEPFNEEMGIDFKKVQNWLNHFKIPLHKMHVSGHGSGIEILEMIKEINPEKIYPIHTEHVESFNVLKEEGIEVIHPTLKNTP
jgi:ribonuclease J